MKNDVIKYFQTVKEDKLEENKKLFANNGLDYSGLVPANFFFIKKNYDRIKPDSLIKKMKIEDSYIISPQIKTKKIEFTIEAINDPSNLVKPLILVFEFPVPYQENAMTMEMHNFLEWQNNKSSINNYK